MRGVARYATVALVCALVTACATAHAPSDGMADPDGGAPPPRDTGVDRPDAPAPTGDAPTPTGDAPAAARTLAWVVTRLSIPSSFDRAPGFDLDGMDSDGTGPACTDAADLVSPVSGAVGVDNQIAVNFVSLWEGSVGSYESGTFDAIARGDWLLGIEAADVDDLRNDTTVALRVGLVTTATGGAPTLLADGSLAPGQSWLWRDDVVTVAIITDGRLATSVPAVPLPLPALDGVLLLPARDVRLEADLSTGALTLGEGGGDVLLTDVGDVLSTVVGPIDETTVRAIVEPDLSRDGTGVCSFVSIGFAFDAVAATISR